MRRTLSIGAGVGAAALALTLAAGVASATSGTHQQAGGAAVASVSKHITQAQAKRIAEDKVPHSKAVEVQSDARHDRGDDRGRHHGDHRDRDGRHHERHDHDRGDDNGRR